MGEMSQKFRSWQDARAEVIGVMISFSLLTFAVIGEYMFGIYGGTYFLPLFVFPVMYLARFKNLDLSSFPYKVKAKSFFYDFIYPVLMIITTFGAVPYFFSIVGIYPQSTFIHVIYTGSLDHAGIHHGWVGWFLIAEGYLYHRLNRHAAKNRRLGELWRNGLLIMGIYLFLDGFWAEQITDGILSWPDPFKYIESLLPFSWRVNFAVDIVVFGLVMLFVLFLNFRYRTKHE